MPGAWIDPEGVVIHVDSRVHEVSEAQWDQLLGINLKGVWLCMKYELIQMRKQGCGTIVNMSSTWGVVGAPGEAPYVASKHGLRGFHECLMLEARDPRGMYRFTLEPEAPGPLQLSSERQGAGQLGILGALAHRSELLGPAGVVQRAATPLHLRQEVVQLAGGQRDDRRLGG